MTSSIEQQITILNGLIETTLDSAYGYKEAAGDAKNLAFKICSKAAGCSASN